MRQPHPSTNTLYLRDGASKIDMVLAYEEQEEHHVNPEDAHEMTKREKRACFEENLRKQGLVLELEPAKRSVDQKTNFLKVSAPDNILKKYAEILNLKLPIRKFTCVSYGNRTSPKIRIIDYGRRQQVEPEEAPANDCGCLSKANSLFDYNQGLIPPEPNFFTAGFLMDREDKFIVKEREGLLNDAQRSMVVWQILLRTKYDEKDPDRVGINRLLNKEVYKAAYPLHDGKYHEDGPKGRQMSDRQLLYSEWGQIGKWFKKQPLWVVKRYFGDKIGLYFAWLGFYTVMLIPAAVVGLIVFLYGLGSLNSENQFPSTEICNDNRTMCPQCDNYCPFWQLKSSCTLSRFTYVFDNGGTVFFAIFMSFWATMFLDFWKRHQAVIAWEWDLSNFEADEQPRPEFEANVKTTRINPVSKKPEAYLPPWSKALRVAFTSSFVLLMLCIVIMAVISVMIYRIGVGTLMFYATKPGSIWYSNARLIVSLTASVLQLILIMILNYFYKHVALWLTNMERPRTQTDFEDSYTFKMFLFQCINFYSSLIYISFFKGKFFSNPGDTESRQNVLTEFANDVCDPAGCFYELCIQLAIIMVGKQFINNFIELLVPKIVTWWKRYIFRSALVSDSLDDTKHIVVTRWELDYALSDLDRLAFLDEYLEMVIQYGFVTLFVAAFPLAPLFALINNIIEIRLDSYKYVTTTKRPLAERAQDIGAWSGILQIITYLSVASNAITIALGSDFIPHLVYKYGYSDTQSLKGFVNFSLTAFNTSDWGDPHAKGWPGPLDSMNGLPTVCYFKAFRGAGPEYELTEAWFHITAAKGAFVLAFEHFVFCLTGIMSMVIPDVPTNVKIQNQRERLLEREILFELEEKREGVQDDENDQSHASDFAHRAFLAGMMGNDEERGGSGKAAAAAARKRSHHVTAVDVEEASP